MRTTDRDRRHERGTQVVELAIVLPLLALLAFIVIEGAAFIRVHQVLNNAAREAARISAERNNAGNHAVAEQAAIDYVNTYAATSCPALTAVVNQSYPIANAGTGGIFTGSEAVVTCQYALKLLPAFAKGMGGTIQLSGRAVFRNFYY